MSRPSLPPESAAQLRALAERLRDLHKRCWTGEGPLAGYYQMRFAAEKPALEAEFASLTGAALHLLHSSCDVTKGWPAFVRQSTGKALPESLRKGAAWESACALDSWLDGQGAAPGDGSIALDLDSWPEGDGVDVSQDATPEDGPGEKGVFHFGGNTAKGIERKPWMLLKLAWERRPNAVDFCDVGEQVWSTDAVATSTIRTAASKANTALAEHGIPLQLRTKEEKLMLE